jgi:hypothetical protein
MAIKFTGPEGLQHVKQPTDTELCFAAVVAAVVGTTVEAAHYAMVRGDISDPDGTTLAPFSAKQVPIDETGLLHIEPVQTPMEGAEDTAGAIELIERQLQARKAVALLALHQKLGGEDFYHWTLLAGLSEDETTKAVASIRVMNPLADRMTEEPIEDFTRFIDRSMPFPGVCAYVIEFQPTPIT